MHCRSSEYRPQPLQPNMAGSLADRFRWLRDLVLTNSTEAYLNISAMMLSMPEITSTTLAPQLAACRELSHPSAKTNLGVHSAARFTKTRPSFFSPTKACDCVYHNIPAVTQPYLP